MAAEKPLLGLCYGPFRDGQSPLTTTFPTEAQVREDIAIMQRVCPAIRTYGADNILFDIPRFCSDAGLDCYPGTWLGGNAASDAQQISNLVAIAGQGYATTKLLIVGNETLLAGEESTASLIGYIAQVKAATSVPVTTAEPWHTWMQPTNAALAAAVDVILIHCHPYWETIGIDNAVPSIMQQYAQVAALYPGKRIIIGETGFPSAGPANGASVPSLGNQERFIRELDAAARSNSVEYLLFEAFDEPWKAAIEGGVGNHWGVYDQNRIAKQSLSNIIVPQSPASLSPDGGAVVIDRTPLLTWADPAGNATWFRIYVLGPSGVTVDQWVQQNEYEISPALSPGDYRWWVYSQNQHGAGGWSGEATFTVQAQKPLATVPIGPRGMQATGVRRPLFSWQSADYATWHHIWVNRLGGGKYAAKWIQAPATNWIPDVDFRGGDYKWWIAGWNVDGYGPWSSGTDFTVPDMRPGVIELLSPTGGVDQTAGHVNYQWAADDRATWYRMWSGQAGQAVVDKWYRGSSVVTDTTASVTEPRHGWGSYNWYVRGWGPDGYGHWSGKGEFVCGRPSPVSGSGTELAWDASRTTEAEWYQVWIGDADLGATARSWWFRTSESTDVGGGNRSVSGTPIVYEGDYEWRIRAWCSVYGTGPWSETSSFNSNVSPPPNSVVGAWNGAAESAYDMVFYEDGTYAADTVFGHRTGSYTFNGSTIWFAMFRYSNTCYFEGTVSGNEIHGTATDRIEETWNWWLRR